MQVVNENGLEFFDLKLKIVEGKINTDLYSKITYSFTYVLPSTYYPYKNIRNVPKGIALRLQRVCDNDEYSFLGWILLSRSICIVRKGVPAPPPPFLRHPPLDPARPLPLLFPFTFVLFHSLLRYFRQFPSPSRNPLLL